MNANDPRNEILELLPLYVLGSLDKDQVLAVEQFIQGDEELLQNLAEVEDTVAKLAHAVPAVAPPQDSLTRLLARIDSSANEVADLAQTDRVEEAQNIQEPPISRRQLFQPHIWAWTTAVLTIICLLLAGYVLQLRRANQQLTRQVEALSQDQQRQASLINDLYLADRVVPLPGTDEAPTATGIFYTQNETGVFVVEGLTPLPIGQTYQLWLVPPGGDADDAVSVGFLPEIINDGTATTQTVTIPPNVLDFYIVDISVEPTGGSENLSGPIVLRGTIE